MGEFKNFIIFSASKDNFAQDLIQKLKKESLGEINLITHRADVVEMISSKGFYALYADETISKRDLEVVCRFLLNSSFYKHKSFYLATSDPAKYKELLETFYQLPFVVINLPLKSDEIAQIILDRERPKDKNVVNEIQQNVSKIKGFKSSNIDLNFLKLFVDATLKVVKEMSFDTTITHLTPMLLEQLSTPPAIAIRGMLEIETKPYTGMFYLSFPKETFLAFYEKVVGEKHQDISADNEDFAKELMNIIYGEAKKNFANLGYGGELGKLIPSLSKEATLNSTQSIIVVPYESSFGTFYIKVAPKESKGSK